MNVITKNEELDPAVDGDKAKHRLTDIDTQYVSLVRAGANRQTQFMIVKEDMDGSGPPEVGRGGGPAQHSCPHCGKPYFGRPMTCPHCGESLRPTNDSEAAAPAEPPPTNKTVPDDDVAPQEKDESSADDLTAFLAQANATVDALLVDATIEHAMAAPPSPAPSSTAADPQSDCADAANSSQNVAHSASLELEAKVQAAEAEAAKARAELLAERARVAQLKAAVGSSTALKTGEVSSSSLGNRHTATGPTTWVGDLASEVARESNAKE